MRHVLRTLVKQGHPGALEMLGFVADTPIVVDQRTVEPDAVAIGSRVRIEVDLRNLDADPRSVLVDRRVDFVKANGSLRPQVFKGATLDLASGATGRVRKGVILA
ncbi:MAG: hypothetical protein U5K81_14525 [Trueperaceae bacterium]|nr:hypothetical protein [Trueperaceae bacterium]